MLIQFVKMIQFSRLVKAEGRLWEFNFRKVKSPGDDLLNVNVCDERGNRIFFSMEKKETDWRIAPGEVPRWIIQNENHLNEAVADELRNW